MVDRISKLDSGMHRVQEARDDRGRHGDQQQEEEEKKKDKDKFEMAKPRLNIGGALGGQAVEGDTDETSLTMSQRVLVLWGILDMTGRPRIPVIITYAVVALVILIAVALIFGIFLKGTT